MVILKNNGYSLMDTIAAAAIIGILVVFMNMFLTCIMGTFEITHKREAAIIARQELYKCMSEKFINEEVIQYSNKYRVDRRVEYRSRLRFLTVTVYNGKTNDALITFEVMLNSGD
jgi:hypothetical protein